MSGVDPAAAHERARTKGVSRHLYWVVRAVLEPFMRLWFRVRIEGAEHVPAQGAAIIAPNHKSFFDAFFVSLASRRPLRFMGKVELFRGPFGWLLLRLGAFPVRRGESDAEALATARAVLDQGELLVLFPEGTRVDEPDALGTPHHGAGRLALEAGVPILPAAITGTSHLWLGPFPKPRLVRIAIDAPVAPPPGGDAEAVNALIDREVWPTVAEEYGRLRATPGVVLAALTTVGLGAGLLARRERRATPRLLGVVPPKKLRGRAAKRRAALDRVRGALHLRR